MSVWRRLFLSGSSATTILVGLTLLTGGLFKVSAFAREAFIAARFGLSAITDAYFGLQQLPNTFATFMFGAFALAFTPAYANTRRGLATVSWLPGLVFYGCVIGLLLTAGMLVSGPVLLRSFIRSTSEGTWSTLAILSLSFAPIVLIGIWAGICTAQGKNLQAMLTTGLPYLVMALLLPVLYEAGALGPLSLPISMTAGFVAVGIFGLFSIVRSKSTVFDWRTTLLPWRISEFRQFLRQLTASSLENVGHAANQILMLYFLAQAGTGAISANNCAMRIGMLGCSLVAFPLAQLLQARICVVNQQERSILFRRWFLMIAAGISVVAIVLHALRRQVIELVYMHGRFSEADVSVVAELLPAWIGYFVVMSLNAPVARYLFTSSRGTAYVGGMLCAYAAANLARLLGAGQMSAAGIIWCAVIAEGCACAANLYHCFAQPKLHAVPAGVARAGEAC